MASSAAASCETEPQVMTATAARIEIAILRIMPLIHQGGPKDYNDLPKAQNRAVQNHQPTRLTLKARPRGKRKSSGAPAHVQPLVAIKNDTWIRVLIMSPMPREGTAGRVPRSSRGCVRHEQSQHQCCGTTKTPCHRGL